MLIRLHGRYKRRYQISTMSIMRSSGKSSDEKEWVGVHWFSSHTLSPKHSWRTCVRVEGTNKDENDMSNREKEDEHRMWCD